MSITSSILFGINVVSLNSKKFYFLAWEWGASLWSNCSKVQNNCKIDLKTDMFKLT